MSKSDAVVILTQTMDVVSRMRRMATTEGEFDSEQQHALQQLYDNEIVPLTALIRKLVDDG